MRALLLVIFTLSLVACQKANESSRSKHRAVYQGNLKDKIKQIYDNKNAAQFYTCDNQWRSRAIQLSTIIENKRREIDLISENETEEPNSGHFTEINGYTFYESNEKSEGADIWSIEKIGWPTAWQTYLRIENDPLNPTWIYLNTMVRSLVLDDENRIESAKHPRVLHDSEPMIDRIYGTIKFCYENSDCILPLLSKEDVTWLNLSPYHAKEWADIISTKSTIETKRLRIQELTEALKIIKDEFGFIKYGRSHVTGNTIHIPLNLEIFGNETNKFSEIVEKLWSTEDVKVKIVSENAGSGYKVIISDTPGERDYVDRESEEIHLFTPIDMSTLTHEFGHVLGYSDRYFTTFNNNNCMYEVESNAADIMSDNTTGRILPSHILKLKEMYL